MAGFTSRYLKRKPRAGRGFQGVTIRRKVQGKRCPGRPDVIPRHKSQIRQGADRVSAPARRIVTAGRGVLEYAVARR